MFDDVQPRNVGWRNKEGMDMIAIWRKGCLKFDDDDDDDDDDDGVHQCPGLESNI